MAYPKEPEHEEYLRYVEQWSNGEGEFSDQPKMSKEEWRKRVKKVDAEEGAGRQVRRSVILGQKE